MIDINVGWHHPVDDSDQWDGFNEPGIEHFAGSPIRHLAREVNQNSFDSGDGSVVKVAISHYLIETSSIPQVEELKATMDLCKDAAAQESDKALQFFSTATKELEKNKISVLEISDFNTRGMKGPSENGTAFYAFMKAKGQSRKASSTATGSFGIGKFAPYAVSKLRTVFVSTVYTDEAGKFNQLTQGKSILMSHDKGFKRLQGAGFWGAKKKCQPVAGVHDDLPDWLLRCTDENKLSESTGTKLIILGFDTSQGWKENLAVSVAENFFGAISAGKLEVDIIKDYVLNSESIKGFFTNSIIREAIDKQKNEPEQFDNCANYLATIQGNAEIIKEESEVLHLGLCELKIFLKEGLPKKVCFLRNGMFISDTLSLAGLKSFSDFKEFVAVVECRNTVGSELLRAMEPPRHDDFEPERLSTKEEQIRGGKALKNLAKWIRDMLKRHAKNPVSEVTTLDELREYFADDSKDGTSKSAEEVDPAGKIIIRAKPLKFKSDNASATTPGNVESERGNDGDEGFDESSRIDGNKKASDSTKDTKTPGATRGNEGIHSEPQGNAGKSAVDTKPKQHVSINNVRAIAIDSVTKKTIFTPLYSGKICLSLLEAGADSDYEIAIINSDQGQVKEGKVYVDVLAKTRVTINLVLSNSFSGALKVVAHEV